NARFCFQPVMPLITHPRLSSIGSFLGSCPQDKNASRNFCPFSRVILYKIQLLHVDQVILSLPYTLSMTSDWRFLCVDALHKPKPVKNTWPTLPTKAIATSRMTRPPLAGTTSRPVPKSCC